MQVRIVRQLRLDRMDSAAFRAELESFGLTQSGLARLMASLGDNRDQKTILRSIQRMAAGDARVSGEMRALLGLLRRAPDTVLPRRTPPHAVNGD